MTKAQLRAMRDRWQRDYSRLRRAYEPIDWELPGDATVETIRNLATAIAWVDGMIAKDSGPAPPPPQGEA